MRSLIATVLVALLPWSPAVARADEPEPRADELPHQDALEPASPDEHRTRVHRGRRGFTSRVGGAALELLGGRTPEDALRLVPGLVIAQHGNEGKGHQIYLRGFDALHGSDFEVRLEGVRLNEASNVHATGYFDLMLLPATLVHEVAVDKGPFSLDQGLFGTAGTASYRLGVDPSRRGVRVAYELGSTSRHRLSLAVSPQEARDESFAGAELVLDDGFGEQRSLSRLALAARLAPPTVGPDAIAAFIALGSARFDLPGLVADADVERGFVAFDGAYFDLGRGESDRLLGVVRHLHDGPRVQVETVLHAGARGLFLRENYTGDLGDPVDGDARTQVERRLHAGLASDLALVLHERLVLEAHLGFRYDTLAQHEDHVGPDGAVLARTRALSASLFELWAAPGLMWRVDPLVLRAGLHLVLTEHRPEDTTARFAAALPRVDLGWQATPALALRLAYGRGARPPEARASLPDRASERAQGGLPAMTLVDALELGARLRAGRFEASLVGFSTWVERESVFDHASGQSLELDGSRRLGVELGLRLAPIDALTLALDATWADARYDRSGDRVPGVAAIVVSGEAILQLAPFRFALRALGVGPRPLAHGATGAGLFDLSLGADWQRAPWRVALSVDNVLDLPQREGVYHFASHWDPATSRTVLPRLHFAAGPPLTARLAVELAL